MLGAVIGELTPLRWELANVARVVARPDDRRGPWFEVAEQLVVVVTDGIEDRLLLGVVSAQNAAGSRATPLRPTGPESTRW